MVRPGVSELEVFVATSSFQTFVVGADQPVGQFLCRNLQNQGLVYKSISLENREKLPTMSGGRPFFVIIPSSRADDLGHALYWLERAQELDATVLLLSSLALFSYRAERQVDEECDDFADTEEAALLQHLEQATRQNERHVILRAGQLISLQGDDFANAVLAAAREQKSVSLDMQRLFDPTMADDIADVLLAIIRQLVCSDDLFGTYHCSGSEPVSAFSFAEALLAQVGQYEDLTELELGSEEGAMMPDVWAVSSDNTLLFHTFGVQQKAWRQGLSRLLQRYYRVDDGASSR